MSRTPNLTIVLIALAVVIWFAAPRPAAAIPAGEKITSGRLDALSPEGEPLGTCPLEHTDVKVEITGFIARTTVTQRFHNPYDEKIEAVYVFPLHQDAAVNEMTMTVGERVIEGEIKERREARRIYEQAKREGHVASLLDQERPNIFTQSVANIEPGEEVTITIGYSQTLAWEDGRFSFDFPMVVGPRYIPGEPIGSEADPAHEAGAPDGELRAPDPGRIIPPQVAAGPNPRPVRPTDQVPDADRITPPVAAKGMRAGHDISLTVRIDAGQPIQAIASEQHEIAIDYGNESKTHATVELKNQRTIPNRDFVLTFRTATDRITDALLTHTDERGKFFTLILQPPRRVVPEQIVPRELIFVIDKSGSMRGFPLKTVKEAMRLCVRNLHGKDTFNLMTFAGGVGYCFEEPVKNTKANRRRALAYIEGLRGSGGTEMMKAVNAALGKGRPDDPDRLRVVCFMTDGYVGNDMAILDAIQDSAGETRVFSFGIGTSVNRYLLDGMAEMGRGEVRYILSPRQAEGAAEEFYERISAPVLTDIEVDWGGLPIVMDRVYPRRIPDLFSVEPVVLKGRYSEEAEGTVTLRGQRADGPYERRIEVDLPAEQPGNAVLAPQWARARVHALMSRDLEGVQKRTADEDLRNKIVELGVKYDLLTQYTSFVAVEEVRITEGGDAETVRVPVEMPRGVSYEGVFGSSAVNGARPGGAARGGGMRGMGMGGFGGASGLRGRQRLRQQAQAQYNRSRLARLSANAAVASDSQPAAGSAQVEGASVAEQEDRTDQDDPTRRLSRKLGPKLRELVEQLDRTRAEDEPSVAGLTITAGRVRVQVTLGDLTEGTLRELEGLDFEELGRAKGVDVVIGTISIEKLKDLALLDVVRRVQAAD